MQHPTQGHGAFPKFPESKEVTLQTPGRDKYGRTIADVLLPDNTNVTDNIQAGDPLPPRLWDNHGVVAMVLHAT